ncbi:MAG: shikimate kinase [Pseudomonadota bacterium]
MQENLEAEQQDQDSSQSPELKSIAKGFNIVLVGLSGSGKSSTGWHLAKSLGFGFIDLDEWIAKSSGRKIEDIFRVDKEQGFRALEIKALKELQQVKNHVIATGGGIASSDEAWGMAKGLGVVVWLDTTIAEMARRLASKDQVKGRPLIAGAIQGIDAARKVEMIEKELSSQLAVRKTRLEKANIALTLTFVPPDIAAQLIHSVLKKGGFLRPRRP